MRGVIFKYEVSGPIGEPIFVHMPNKAKILHIGVQGHRICLWAIVPEALIEDTRTFYIFGTGWVIDVEGLAYIGTVQVGPYVWHVFEQNPPSPDIGTT